MSNFQKVALLVFISLTVGISTQVNAQSGTRSSGGGGSSRISQQQQAQVQQQLAEFRRAQEIEIARQQRIALFQQLASNPDAQLNRRQNANAYKEAKAEFTAIKRMNIPVSAAGNSLESPFLLRSSDINRSTRMVSWPDALLDAQHRTAVLEIENRIAGNHEENQTSAEEFLDLFQQLSQDLGRRVIQKDISQRDYAKAKRFLSGLANEVKFPAAG